MATETRSLCRQEFLVPRYWPAWLLLGLMWILSRLPFHLAMRTGRLAGRIGLRLAPYRRHIVATNLALCFPEESPATRARWLRQQFESLGMAAVETSLLWMGRREKVLGLLRETQGMEHLDRALARGRGVVLLAGHFTDLEIGAVLAANLHSGAAVYRPHKDPFFEAVMSRSRTRHGSQVRRADARAMLRALRENKLLWYAPDQNYEGAHSTFAPFFGIPAATNAAAGRIATISEATVLPFTQHRLAEDRGYRLVFFPPIEGLATGDPVTDARRLNQVIEDLVRTRPAEYLWAHRRFKSRPDGEPMIYKPKPVSRRRRRKKAARRYRSL